MAQHGARLFYRYFVRTRERRRKRRKIIISTAKRARKKLTLIEYLKHRFLQLHSRVSNRGAKSSQRRNNNDTQSTTSRCLARSVRPLQSIVDKKPSKSHWPSTDNRTLHLATRHGRGRPVASQHPLLLSFRFLR